MKKIVLIMGILGLMSCTPQETKRISLLVDVTEQGSVNVIPNDTNRIGYPHNLWDGSIIRYSLLKDVHHTDVTEIILPSAHQWVSNQSNREYEVENFKNELRALGHHDSLEYNYSSIWKPFMEELHYVSQESIPSTIYLISDLMEHTPHWISFYDPQTLKQLRTQPEVLREQFASMIPNLPATDHITVVVVHEASNINESELFSLIYEQIYKPLLEEQGISCSVQTKL